MKKPELLAPAGTMEKLKVALLYGADAAYVAGKSFGLRAFGGNFTREELKDAVGFAHARNKKLYVTLNIYAHNSDIEQASEYIAYLGQIGVDAVLVSDLGLFMLCKEQAPNLPVHISTQANNTNWRTAEAWKALGATRVVLARELSFPEIAKIRKQTDVELEMFVHGAMCISYSGRCLLSNFFTHRDANRGMCAQVCRWKFALSEEKSPGKYFPIAEDERGTYILNSKDLCLLDRIDAIVKLGVDSLKIEGRMKSVHYVASVTKIYREAIDACYAGEDVTDRLPQWRKELEKISHRPYTEAFYDWEHAEATQNLETSKNMQSTEFVGLVRSYDENTKMATIEQRNHIRAGERVEIFQPTLPSFSQEIKAMLDSEGNTIQAAPHAQQIFRVQVQSPVEPYAIVRRNIG